MKLGVFSISLTVKNLQDSKQFYEKLGFSKFAGDESMGYLIMKNDETIIGLFQGMFDQNILTFNPGWDHNAQEVNPFKDVRAISKHLEEQGIKLDQSSLEGDSGPGNLSITDPDGNKILIDQHR